MRRARLKKDGGASGSGSCDPSGIPAKAGPSAIHAARSMNRPPTNLVKSSPTWFDSSTSMTENLSPDTPVFSDGDCSP